MTDYGHELQFGVFLLPSPHRLTICLPLRELPTPSVLTSSPSKTTLTRHGFWIR